MKRPERYNQLLADSTLPIDGGETLTPQERHEEQVMPGLRLKEGVPRGLIGEGAEGVVEKYVAAGLLTAGERVAVTDAGRLLADGIVTDILAAEEAE